MKNTTKDFNPISVTLSLGQFEGILDLLQKLGATEEDMNEIFHCHDMIEDFRYEYHVAYGVEDADSTSFGLYFSKRGLHKIIDRDTQIDNRDVGEAWGEALMAML